MDSLNNYSKSINIKQKSEMSQKNNFLTKQNHYNGEEIEEANESEPPEEESTRANDGHSEIEVSFFTELEEEEYKCDETQYMINTNTTPIQLSQLLNEILCLSPTKHFYFLINGKVLLQPISDFLKNENITSECGLQVEYLLAMDSPTTNNICNFDDWISSITISKQSSVVVSWMDGIWRAFSHEEKLARPSVTFKQSDISIMSLAITENKKSDSLFMHNESVKKGEKSSDRGKVGNEEIKVWVGLKNGILETSILNLTSGKTVKNEIGLGHVDSINCICVNSDEEYVCTGGHDSKILLWKNNEAYVERSDEDILERKRKLVDRNMIEPKQNLSKHALPVTDVCFMCGRNNCFVLSSSLDNSIIAWDIITASPFTVWSVENACTAITTVGSSVCTGHENGKVTIWDIRSSHCVAEIGESNNCKSYALDSSSLLISKQHYRCHSRMLSCVRWNTHDKNLIASSSYDGLIQIFDVRANKLPLQTVVVRDNNSKTKILACNWVSKESLLSGGSDGILRSHCLSS